METINATKKQKLSYFLRGVKDGIPIGLGYLAVSFALGINARNAGFNWFQAGLCSFLINASAGEYAIFSMMASGAGLITTAIMVFIANARYLLMSFAMSQKIDPRTGLLHRLLLGFDLTDELFAIGMAVEGPLNPIYSYGAFCMALPGWSVGTALGVLVGNLLTQVGTCMADFFASKGITFISVQPNCLISALSVGLYGMFIAIIIPPAKKNKIIAALVAVSFILSYCADRFIKLETPGVMVIVLTVVISLAAALFFPREDDENE